MKEFEYKVSLVIPVYNAENYLEECLVSVLHQSINKEDLEVLLINDGSTDNSLNICKEYQEINENFKVFTKENGGVSSARNYGIKIARGKYIMYLDADDTLSKDTIRNVVVFFDNHYEEVDLVTYSEISYINEKEQQLHFRYNFLKNSGIYDLKEFPYALQTRLGICVKNRCEKNILFDETLKYHEDQKYIVNIIQEKMKIGFVKEAIYYWKRNESGAMANDSNPIKVFEVALKMYEEIFSQYDEVPKYFQSMYIHDLNWKMRSNMLFPYHYNKEEFEIAIRRMKNLLKKVDSDTIKKFPRLSSFHISYFLRLKESFLTGIVDNGEVEIFETDQCIYKGNGIELVVCAIKIFDGKIKIDGILKSPVFDFVEKPTLFMLIDDKNGNKEKIELDLFDSAEGYYQTKTKTNLFWGFVLEHKIIDDCKIYFKVKLDDIEMDISYYFMKQCSIGANQKTLISKEYFILYQDKVFNVYKIDLKKYLNEIKDYLGKKQSIFEVGALENYYKKHIWLYYDCKGVEKDNAYYQFCHDIKKDDGIERYYICANDIQEYSYLFVNFQDRVIKFGSKKHRILYLAAEKVLTAYIEEKNFNPFDEVEYQAVKQFINHEIIYLQHGILHAHLPWKYAPGRIAADRIVVSSYFELENFHNIYNFPKYMLIPSGMSRFEQLNKKEKTQNKILFAPSWRNYLIGPAEGNKWILTKEKFLNSDYFNKINKFLNYPQLEELLNKYNLVLEFKIHPIFIPYLNMFDNVNSKVKFVTEKIREEDYKIIITDFSSFIFDFAYLERAIIYYVPDYLEFKAGLNQYWELDLPFEKAFGKLTLEINELIHEIEKICENSFKAETIYSDRMQQFFLPMRECCKGLYQYLSTERDD